MFDNFGLGEFFFLAILALLFFGPERLPQIGARLGRWVSSLTQYSKAFMTEWRDEALAIHEAVEEVRGIRDEIAAARAEISSSLDTAREDLTEGLDAAKDAVSSARSDVMQRVEKQRDEAAQDLERMAREERGEATGDASGEDVAIAKTQQILANLQGKREAAADEASGGEEEWDDVRRIIEEGMAPKGRDAEAPAEVPAVEGEAEPAASPAEGESPAVVEGAPPEPPKESAFDRTQKILADLKRRRLGLPEESPPEGEAASLEEAPEPAVAGETPPEPPKESAFDRTARIAADLRRRRSGLPEESSPEGPATAVEGAPPEPPKESAFDRTQKIVQDLKKRRSAKETTPQEQAVEVPVLTLAEFEQLSSQVARLQDEMSALRQELQALRTLTAQGTPPQDLLSASDDVSVEEAA